MQASDKHMYILFLKNGLNLKPNSHFIPNCAAIELMSAAEGNDYYCTLNLTKVTFALLNSHSVWFVKIMSHVQG